jgi:hypothetical protein
LRTTELARIKDLSGTDDLRSGVRMLCYRYGKGAAEPERMDYLEFIISSSPGRLGLPDFQCF